MFLIFWQEKKLSVICFHNLFWERDWVIDEKEYNNVKLNEIHRISREEIIIDDRLIALQIN